MILWMLACGGGEEDLSDWKGPTKSRGEGKEPTVEQLGAPRDVLVIAMQSDLGNLLPVVMSTATEYDFTENINRTLLDRTFECGLKFHPGIAKSWEFDETSTKLTMQLRDDVLWSDGTKLTAHDVAFTYELIRDPIVASPRIDFMERMKPDADPLVVDDFTIEWHFTEAYAQTVQLAHVGNIPLVPKHLLEGADRATLRGHAYNRDPLGTGPWKIKEWAPNERVVLHHNPNFSGGPEEQPRLKRIVFRVLPEYSTRLVELETGKVDMAMSVQVADADRLTMNNPDITLYRRGWRSQDFITYNRFDPADYKAKSDAANGAPIDWSTVAPHPVLADPGVRKALSKAINVDKIIADLLTSKMSGERYAKRSVSTVTPAICNAGDPGIQPIRFDPEAAKSDLDALGWVDTDGDSIRDKDGKRLSFTLRTNSGNPRRAAASILIQAMLKDVGVEVNLERIEANTFFAGLRAKQYDAALSGWAAGLYVDLSALWRSGDEHKLNYPSYANPEVDALIDAALVEPDPDKGAEMWKKVQRLIYADQPYTFLYWRDEVAAIHSRFKDVKADEISNWRDLNTWWVPGNEVKYKR